MLQSMGSKEVDVTKQLNKYNIYNWVFIGRTDVEAETPILWPPDVKN